MHCASASEIFDEMVSVTDSYRFRGENTGKRLLKVADPPLPLSDCAPEGRWRRSCWLG